MVKNIYDDVILEVLVTSRCTPLHSVVTFRGGWNEASPWDYDVMNAPYAYTLGGKNLSPTTSIGGREAVPTL